METNEVQNQNVEQSTVESVEVIPAPVPQPKAGDKAMQIISTVLGAIGVALGAIALLGIFVLVLKYNMAYGFKTIYGQAAINEMLATAALYKEYAKTIILFSIAPLVLGLVAIILAKVQSKKGFKCKIGLILGIVAMGLAGLAMMNCVLNLFLFGRYKVKYI